MQYRVSLKKTRDVNYKTQLKKWKDVIHSQIEPNFIFINQINSTIIYKSQLSIKQTHT